MDGAAAQLLPLPRPSGPPDCLRKIGGDSVSCAVNFAAGVVLTTRPDAVTCASVQRDSPEYHSTAATGNTPRTVHCASTATRIAYTWVVPSNMAIKKARPSNQTTPGERTRPRLSRGNATSLSGPERSSSEWVPEDQSSSRASSDCGMGRADSHRAFMLAAPKHRMVIDARLGNCFRLSWHSEVCRAMPAPGRSGTDESCIIGAALASISSWFAMRGNRLHAGINNTIAAHSRKGE